MGKHGFVPVGHFASSIAKGRLADVRGAAWGRNDDARRDVLIIAAALATRYGGGLRDWQDRARRTVAREVGRRAPHRPNARAVNASPWS